MVTFIKSAGRKGCSEDAQDGDEHGVNDEQNYIQALGADTTEGEWLISYLAKLKYISCVPLVSCPVCPCFLILMIKICIYILYIYTPNSIKDGLHYSIPIFSGIIPLCYSHSLIALISFLR